MISNKISMYGNTDIMKHALDASWKRNKVLNENIANIDTPGYKRKEVAFDEYMSKALKHRNDMSGTSFSGPRVYEDKTNLSYRIDGNNVDVDTEMVYLAENQLKYNTLISQVNYNFERIKSVMNR